MTVAEREVQAHLVGKRYDCDECGSEVARTDDASMLTTWPPKYRHQCPNGHVADLQRPYPGYDILITQEPS